MGNGVKINDISIKKSEINAYNYHINRNIITFAIHMLRR